jgi:hypothetical protein
MAFQNIPLKSTQVVITSVVGTATMAWYNPLNFPAAPGFPAPLPVQKDFKWEITMDISSQSHSSYATRKPGAYTGMDINVGQWIANLTSGQAWQIISIESKSSTQATAIVQDIYRYNTFRDITQVGNGAPISGTYVVFSIGDTGLPQIDPAPPAGTSASFAINIQSRFEYINLQYDYPLYQADNTFSLNDLIAVNTTTHDYVLADDAHKLIVGRITSISDTITGWFTINPVQKIVDNLDYLPGFVGDTIYSSTTIPGGITADPGGAQIYIKLRDYTSSTTTSMFEGPTITGSILQINSTDVTINGTGSIADIISATNAETLNTGVIASAVLSATTVQTSPGLIAPAYGEPALWASSSPASASINGVPVTFNITSTNPGYEDYALPLQMAASINAASIPDITASTNGALSLIVTNTAGGAITIVNITADVNGVEFAGADSGSGLVLSTVASTTILVNFLAVDARAINFIDVLGSPVNDFGIMSVENGTKACGLYIEEGLRSATSTVVTNLAQLNALNPLIGDQAYVIDSADTSGNNVGEWSLWLFNGSVWIQTSNQDSSTTDAKSLEYTFTSASAANLLIGQISTNRRVSLITIEVITPFDGAATVSIGYQVNNPVLPPAVPDGLMSVVLTDLSVAGTYTTSTDVLFGIDTEQGDVVITASFDNGASTIGVAQIIVSYA